MRLMDNFLRFFVGILFIFSGLIKINDPIGTSIKLKEYFEVFANDFASFFEIFVPYSLPIAIFVIVLEVLLGVALLIWYRMNLTGWLYLLLILFFTFLTFYSAVFNKVTDCGCFGDAIPMTPWQSFGKDVILLVMVVMIFIRRKKYKPAIGHPKRDIVMIAALAVNLFLAIYAIRHLPFLDFRPYKVGNHIPSLMEPSEPYRYKYIMEKDGETYEFTEYPQDTSYIYKDLELLNPEAQPKITDYHIWNDSEDLTQESFTGTKLFLIIHDVSRASTKNMDDIKSLIDAVRPEIEVWVLTASGEAEFEVFRHEYQLDIPYYFADMTVLEAIIRSNPGFWLLKNGAVKGKWHHNDVPEAKKIFSLSD